VPDSQRCIVVGAGLLGLSSAWALARRGWEVGVLEAAASPGHERAGSKGTARIFRLGYPDPLYVEMAMLARARWHELEAANGSRLLHVTGQVTLGDEATLHAIADALTAAGAPVQPVSSSEAAERFGGIAVPQTGTAKGTRTEAVLLEPDSGVLVADACLRALRASGGFQLRSGDAAERLVVERDAIVVETADGLAHRADIVVVCAGAASLGLLHGANGNGRVAAPTSGSATVVGAKPSLPQVAYFAARGNEPLPPVFIEWGDAMIYGLPVPGNGPHGGTYKVSHHTPGPDLDAFDPADPAPLGRDDPALLKQLTGAVTRLLPALHPEPVATERCVYDNSADTDFIIDRVDRIVVGCGTSGHAFKFGPLLGELLADLAGDRRPAVDLERFSLRRTPLSPDGAPLLSR
jgi:sarcosine oxidase